MDAYLMRLTQSHITYMRSAPLAPRTSFRIGGEASVLVLPRSFEELSLAIGYAKECGMGFRILGRGTNLLVDDGGMHVPVIATEGLQSYIFDRDRVHADAGLPLARLILRGIAVGKGGLERLFGIPGTVGGAVRMNAGAYGQEIADVFVGATVLDTDTMRLLELTAEEMSFSYRFSLLSDPRFVLLRATFSLEDTDPFYARTLLESISQKRRQSQPLDLPSAGSVFRRPSCGYASQMIDQAGLKGYRIGDAAVSSKHAGFIVNLGHATSQDVKALIAHICHAVFDRFGVWLQTEIEIWTGG